MRRVYCKESGNIPFDLAKKPQEEWEGMAGRDSETELWKYALVWRNDHERGETNSRSELEATR